MDKLKAFVKNIGKQIVSCPGPWLILALVLNIFSPALGTRLTLNYVDEFFLTLLVIFVGVVLRYFAREFDGATSVILKTLATLVAFLVIAKSALGCFYIHVDNHRFVMVHEDDNVYDGLKNKWSAVRIVDQKIGKTIAVQNNGWIQKPCRHCFRVDRVKEKELFVEGAEIQLDNNTRIKLTARGLVRISFGDEEGLKKLFLDHEDAQAYVESEAKEMIVKCLPITQSYLTARDAFELSFSCQRNTNDLIAIHKVIVSDIKVVN